RVDDPAVLGAGPRHDEGAVIGPHGAPEEGAEGCQGRRVAEEEDLGSSSSDGPLTWHRTSMRSVYRKKSRATRRVDRSRTAAEKGQLRSARRATARSWTAASSARAAGSTTVARASWARRARARSTSGVAPVRTAGSR